MDTSWHGISSPVQQLANSAGDRAVGTMVKQKAPVLGQGRHDGGARLHRLDLWRVKHGRARRRRVAAVQHQVELAEVQLPQHLRARPARQKGASSSENTTIVAAHVITQVLHGMGIC